MTTIKTWNISGMGGGYENACQKMLWAGVKYMDTVRNAQDIMKGRKTYKNIYGIVDMSPLFDECKKVMLKAVNNDFTGAMMQCVTGHLKYIVENGYDEWFATLLSDRDFEQPIEFEDGKCRYVILCEECQEPAGCQSEGHDLCAKCMLEMSKTRFTNIDNKEEVQQFLEDNV